MRGRLQSNGNLVFPMRGRPPVCPSGYEMMPGLEYEFRPKLPICPLRSIKPLKQPCGRIRPEFFCADINKFVERQICAECGGKGLKDEEHKNGH